MARLRSDGKQWTILKPWPIGSNGKQNGLMQAWSVSLRTPPPRVHGGGGGGGGWGAGDTIPYRYAISLGTPMDREEMAQVPQLRAATEVMRIYRKGSWIAIRLARYIRSLGWPAKAYADGEDILQIPMAVNAGLGQLGKHGSLISEEFGSNFRLAAVLTDLPLTCDAPVDIGVDDLCMTCRRCVEDCPPNAILDDKQLVRGVEKWYVDFDKCIPYFVKTAGCAICLEVCPWSEPGRGPKLSSLLLSKRRDASSGHEGRG